MSNFWEVLTPIEWFFTVLVYVAFFLLTSKKAKNPRIRAYGFAIDFIAGFLQMIFLMSKGIVSMAFISFTFLFIKINGIKNCLKEGKGKKNE